MCMDAGGIKRVGKDRWETPVSVPLGPSPVPQTGLELNVDLHRQKTTNNRVRHDKATKIHFFCMGMKYIMA
jgi:hypothetical protein